MRLLAKTAVILQNTIVEARHEHYKAYGLRGRSAVFDPTDDESDSVTERLDEMALQDQMMSRSNFPDDVKLKWLNIVLDSSLIEYIWEIHGME